MTPDQEKPKDAMRERAERIVRGDWTHGDWGCPAEHWKELEKRIADELRAVAEEATVDMFENMKQAKAEGVREESARLQREKAECGHMLGCSFEAVPDGVYCEACMARDSGIREERERCAKIVDKYWREPYPKDAAIEAENIANEIRAEAGK